MHQDVCVLGLGGSPGEALLQVVLWGGETGDCHQRSAGNPTLADPGHDTRPSSCCPRRRVPMSGLDSVTKGPGFPRTQMQGFCEHRRVEEALTSAGVQAPAGRLGSPRSPLSPCSAAWPASHHPQCPEASPLPRAAQAALPISTWGQGTQTRGPAMLLIDVTSRNCSRGHPTTGSYQPPLDR